jgi:hypothetical protein
MNQTTNGRRVMQGELIPEQAHGDVAPSKMQRDIAKALPASEELRLVVRESTGMITDALKQIAETVQHTHFRVEIEEEINVIERY